MTEKHRPFEFYQGDTWEIDAVCTDADGNPLDLTDASVEWRLNSLGSDGLFGLNVLSATIGDGVTVMSASDGTVAITISATLTQNIAPGYYEDQLRVVTAQNLVSTQSIGRVDIRATLP